ncbi:hypothetical protein F7R20_07530 [Pseudomonas brassicacearum subsp. brassicacearum]|nr:hypothetical protein F7R20_07530 [Pseudomonas brassicacearum subsp. brassicacearum]QEO81642.1 hypothetical protein ELZ14_30400 [Pseudomonas brassicacearum]
MRFHPQARRSPCGSGLARESGGSVGIDVGYAAVIASKLAPTEGCSGYRAGFSVGYANLPITPAVRSGCGSPRPAHGRHSRACLSG